MAKLQISLSWCSMTCSYFWNLPSFLDPLAARSGLTSNHFCSMAVLVFDLNIIEWNLFTEGNLQSWMLLHSPSCLWCPFSWWFELLKLIHHNKPYQSHASPIVQSLDVCFLIHLFETSFVFYHTPLHPGLAFHSPPCQAPSTNCSTAPPSSLSGIHSQYSHILVQSMV